MLVTSIFTISHNVFKRLLSKGHKMWGLCGDELNKCFLGIYWNQPVCPFMCLSVCLQIIGNLVSQMPPIVCCYCVETLWIYL